MKHLALILVAGVCVAVAGTVFITYVNRPCAIEICFLLHSGAEECALEAVFLNKVSRFDVPLNASMSGKVAFKCGDARYSSEMRLDEIIEKSGVGI